MHQTRPDQSSRAQRIQHAKPGDSSSRRGRGRHGHEKTKLLTEGLNFLLGLAQDSRQRPPIGVHIGMQNQKAHTLAKHSGRSKAQTVLLLAAAQIEMLLQMWTPEEYEGTVPLAIGKVQGVPRVLTRDSLRHELRAEIHHLPRNGRHVIPEVETIPMEEDHIRDKVAPKTIVAHPHAKGPDRNVVPTSPTQGTMRPVLEHENTPAIRGEPTHAPLTQRKVGPALGGIKGAPGRAIPLVLELEIGDRTTRDPRHTQRDAQDGHPPLPMRVEVDLLVAAENIQPEMRGGDRKRTQMLARPAKHQGPIGTVLEPLHDDQPDIIREERRLAYPFQDPDAPTRGFLRGKHIWRVAWRLRMEKITHKTPLIQKN